ncbi:hypothetical protein PVAND_001656 [Polypedilum vanderplanki]|uniref:C2H2-type domain-containing protein n=1 Tax=Polypedilum vanderplanki TaxID=319348 RepID=A0A9J6BP30_POLVA|nr:hypothetical protein PVAND_001656 [Polypedilum vanderplanki]
MQYCSTHVRLDIKKELSRKYLEKEDLVMKIKQGLQMFWARIKPYKAELHEELELKNITEARLAEAIGIHESYFHYDQRVRDNLEKLEGDGKIQNDVEGVTYHLYVKTFTDPEKQITLSSGQSYKLKKEVLIAQKPAIIHFKLTDKVPDPKWNQVVSKNDAGLEKKDAQKLTVQEIFKKADVELKQEMPKRYVCQFCQKSFAKWKGRYTHEKYYCKDDPNADNRVKIRCDLYPEAVKTHKRTVHKENRNVLSLAASE